MRSVLSVSCLCLLALSLSSTRSPGQGSGISSPHDSFIDGAVDARGVTWVLNHSGLKRIDPNGNKLDIGIGEDLKPAFTSFGYQALSVHEVLGPAVLWSGRRGGAIESVVSFVNDRRNVLLKPAINFAPSVCIAPNQEIFVFGVSFEQKPQQLVHRYSKVGAYLGSFNPFVIASPIEPSERRKLGRSRIVVSADGMFALSPLFDSRVLKCVDGNIDKTFDFGTASPEGLKRRPITMFLRDGKAYVQVFAGGPKETARHELYVYEDGDFHRALTTPVTPGQVLGIRPDGQIVTRDVTATAARDSIDSKAPESPR
jgi:hypothetical protein